MKLPVYKKEKATRKDFVKFWSQLYDYPNEHLYTKNIGKKPTEDRLLALFEWKIGERFWEFKQDSIRVNFIDRLGELEERASVQTVKQLLGAFQHGGAIYRIFWLHCLQPKRFPIFDQHVYRAMKFVQTGAINEIPKSEVKKIDSYIREYIPFFAKFDDQRFTDREVDKALWAFGAFIKNKQYRTAFHIQP